MTGDPYRHTKSEGLKRLLRRRGRRIKPRANSGEEVQSWAEYGPVKFTPTGDSSALGCMFVAFATAGALVLVPAIFFFAGMDKANNAIPITDFVKEVLLASLVLLLLGAPLILPLAFGLWTYARLDGDGTKDRERLIAAADRLRAEQAETQDAGANHGN